MGRLILTNDGLHNTISNYLAMSSLFRANLMILIEKIPFICFFIEFNWIITIKEGEQIREIWFCYSWGLDY